MLLLIIKSGINPMQTTEIETRKAPLAWFALKDANKRIAHALETASDYFNDPQYKARLDEVTKIVKGFFRVSKGFYINPRLNNGKPFTTVKVDNPVFPNHLTSKQRQEMFYDPLEALGVEIRFSKGTNSYLFKVK
jgi:hypothetical protein